MLSNSIRPLSSTLDFSQRPITSTSPDPASRPDSPELIDSGYSSGSQSPPNAKPAPLPTDKADDGPVRRRLSASDDGAEETELRESEVAEVKLRDATKAFFGGINNHSQAAKEMMRTLRVAVLKNH